MSDTSKSQFVLRQQIQTEAHNLTYYGTALNVVPNTPENEHTRSRYEKAFKEACVEMAKLLEVENGQQD